MGFVSIYLHFEHLSFEGKVIKWSMAEFCKKGISMQNVTETVVYKATEDRLPGLANPVPDSTEGISWYKTAVENFIC